MGKTKKQIFVVGTQRSGTTLLRLIINSHPRIAMSREAGFLMPFLDRKYINGISGSTLKDFYKKFLTTQSHILESYSYYTEFFSKLDPNSEIKLKDLITGLFESYCRIEGKEIWGNKTPSFTRKIDMLQELFPDAMFIHIV